MGIVVGIAVGVILIFLIGWVIATYNGIRKTDLKYQEALSDVDVALAKRHDELTKLLGAAKKYSEYEQATILQTINLRKNTPLSEKIKASNKMDKVQTYLFGLMENYPDLKASVNWQELQAGIEDCEEHLQAARRCVNANATQYNNYIVTFPSSVIANMFGCKVPKPYWEATDEQKQDVVIE